jgi:hypothetical protein
MTSRIGIVQYMRWSMVTRRSPLPIGIASRIPRCCSSWRWRHRHSHHHRLPRVVPSS